MKLARSGQFLTTDHFSSLKDTEWLALELAKFYTYRQIEKFDLQDQVCYCTFDNDAYYLPVKDDVDYDELPKTKYANEEDYNSPEKKLKNGINYCICVCNIDRSHFVSLVSLKLFLL